MSAFILSSVFRFEIIRRLDTEPGFFLSLVRLQVNVMLKKEVVLSHAYRLTYLVGHRDMQPVSAPATYVAAAGIAEGTSQPLLSGYDLACISNGQKSALADSA